MPKKVYSYSCPGCGFGIAVDYPYPPTCPICGGQLVKAGNILADTGKPGGNKKAVEKGKRKNGKAEIR